MTDTREWASRQGHRLIQAGVTLFLVALFVGLAIPKFTVPRLALSAHLLGIMQGFLLILAGLIWPRLKLALTLARVGFWLAIYGCLAAWSANLLGAIWGAGNTLLPMAAGQAHGSPFQEGVIVVALRSGAVALIAATLLVLWGLRRPPASTPVN
ncbi:MAG TPA: hypothetical protein VNI57_12930 [Candidatus Saccharimonadales bacterium]|nr:hypothetical protein [Candidatus Saccharimonadales bacterium]